MKANLAFKRKKQPPNKQEEVMISGLNEEVLQHIGKDISIKDKKTN